MAPQRYQDGAEATELEHQRGMVSLRADGVIANLCPTLSDTTASMAIMTVPTEEADQVMAEDTCIRAGIVTYETYRKPVRQHIARRPGRRSLSETVRGSRRVR